MKFLRLSYVNFKRLGKNITFIVLMFLLPLTIVLGIHFVGNSGDHSASIDVVFNIKDKGTYGEEVLKNLNIDNNVFYDNEKALELLEKNEIVGLYIIPEDFTQKIKSGEKPTIKALKREEGNTTMPLEMNLNDEINNKIKEEILLKNNIIEDKKELYGFNIKTLIDDKDKERSSKVTGEFYITVFMLIYFIILSSTGIGDEMLKLRKENVLSRAMTTPNTGYEIMGSLFLAILVFFVSANLLALFISKWIIGFSLADFPIIFINIVLASMFSITLTIFLTRISDDPTFASLVPAVYSVASFFLSIMALESDFYSKVPKTIINLGKFAPQYWLMDSIENGRLFPNIVVLLLMILALFTAGNFKFNNFVNKS